MPDYIMFVSLGPGDPELITLKSLKILRQADIILCPSTRTAAGDITSRASDMLSELDIDEKKIELFDVPMNKDRTKALESYKQVSDKIAGYFTEGLKIAVTAEGDAGFYSSIHYINDNLNRTGIPTMKSAGVPAFIACGALANIHIVKQEEKLAVIPGTITRAYLLELINTGKTVVIMKPSRCEDAIKEALSPTLAFHYFENVGIPEKEFYIQNIKEIKERKFPYFSLLIVQKKQTT